MWALLTDEGTPMRETVLCADHHADPIVVELVTRYPEDDHDGGPHAEVTLYLSEDFPCVECAVETTAPVRRTA